MDGVLPRLDQLEVMDGDVSNVLLSEAGLLYGIDGVPNRI